MRWTGIAQCQAQVPGQDLKEEGKRLERFIKSCVIPWRMWRGEDVDVLLLIGELVDKDVVGKTST